MGIRARGKKRCKEEEQQQKPPSWTRGLQPALRGKPLAHLVCFPIRKTYASGIGRNCLSAISQAKILLTGRCQIKSERGLQPLQHHNKHRRRSQICLSSFLILKSIRISNTQETGHVLISKTSTLEGPSNDTDYHKASIFQQPS